VADQLSGGVAASLTDRMLAHACECLSALRVAGLELPLWTLIEGDALTDVARADRLIAIVGDRGADPRHIVYTVGERAVRRSTAAELDVLTRLRVKGFGLCLDNFGGGRGSDDALARIPLTEVALTPALVSGAGHDRGRAEALEDALEAIRELGLPAVARGCDAATDYELLLLLGCNHAQGDFIAGGLSSDQLVEWARTWRAPPMRESSP
jgi:EAL domain-containing protein (putative c-di-GMP-specific phosphodiesterase class I)